MLKTTRNLVTLQAANRIRRVVNVRAFAMLCILHLYISLREVFVGPRKKVCPIPLASHRHAA